LRSTLLGAVAPKGARSPPRFRDLSGGALAFDCMAGDYQNRTAACPKTASNPAPDPLTCSGDDGGTAGQRFEHRKLLPSLSARLTLVKAGHRMRLSCFRRTDATAPPAETLPASKNFLQNVFHTKATPFLGQNHFWTGFCQRGHD